MDLRRSLFVSGVLLVACLAAPFQAGAKQPDASNDDEDEMSEAADLSYDAAHPEADEEASEADDSEHPVENEAEAMSKGPKLKHITVKYPASDMSSRAEPDADAEADSDADSDLETSEESPEASADAGEDTDAAEKAADLDEQIAEQEELLMGAETDEERTDIQTQLRLLKKQRSALQAAPHS